MTLNSRKSSPEIAFKLYLSVSHSRNVVLDNIRFEQFLVSKSLPYDNLFFFKKYSRVVYLINQRTFKSLLMFTKKNHWIAVFKKLLE